MVVECLDAEAGALYMSERAEALEVCMALRVANQWTRCALGRGASGSTWPPATSSANAHLDSAVLTCRGLPPRRPALDPIRRLPSLERAFARSGGCRSQARLLQLDLGAPSSTGRGLPHRPPNGRKPLICRIVQGSPLSRDRELLRRSSPGSVAPRKVWDERPPSTRKKAIGFLSAERYVPASLEGRALPVSIRWMLPGSPRHDRPVGVRAASRRACRTLPGAHSTPGRWGRRAGA